MVNKNLYRLQTLKYRPELYQLLVSFKKENAVTKGFGFIRLLQ
jgi:hypothetical protein